MTELLNNKGYVDKEVFDFFSKKVKQNLGNADKFLQVIADFIRFNTLLSVARAGTGHLGASLSIVELLTEIYFRSFNLDSKNRLSKNRDIFILSKGHAAPSLYATLVAKGYIRTGDLDKLRRLNGLPGHCDISTAGVEANTGSLAMGLSKAVGYAIAKKRFKLAENVITIVGDGELQEGQCWEALLSAASYKCNNFWIVIDVNKIQTDDFTKNIVTYGNLPKVFREMGFAVEEGNGQSVKLIHQVFQKLKKIKDKPKIFYCHTIKGQGISFMEHTNVLKSSKDRYIWHNKAPNIEQLENALSEIINRSAKALEFYGFYWDLKKASTNIPIEPPQKNINGDNLIAAFSKAIADLGRKYKNIVVLDGDLEEDCGFTKFHKLHPKRFFEMGIMEQHMVSVACAVSRQGYIPIIGSYAAFLTSRANEQLYNLATEGVKAIILGSMAGVIPATPGKSHQAFRDIACMKNIPHLTMYQPVTSEDIKHILTRYFEDKLGNLLYLRLSMAASAVKLLVSDKNLKKGYPQIMRKGKDIIIIGIGPVILGECMKAAEILARDGIEVEIWNHPWLVDFDKKPFISASARNLPLFIVEDHYIKGGMGESLLAFLNKENILFKSITHVALKDFPKAGFREEALKIFGLDYDSIRQAVIRVLQK